MTAIVVPSGRHLCSSVIAMAPRDPSKFSMKKPGLTILETSKLAVRVPWRCELLPTHIQLRPFVPNSMQQRSIFHFALCDKSMIWASLIPAGIELEYTNALTSNSSANSASIYSPVSVNPAT